MIPWAYPTSSADDRSDRSANGLAQGVEGARQQRRRQFVHHAGLGQVRHLPFDGLVRPVVKEDVLNRRELRAHVKRSVAFRFRLTARLDHERLIGIAALGIQGHLQCLLKRLRIQLLRAVAGRVDVRDVVDANVQALNIAGPEFEIINVGSGEAQSVLQLAEKIKAVSGSSSVVEISGRYRIGDIRNCIADISHAKNVLGFAPQFSIADSVRDLVEWASDRTRGKDLDLETKELGDHGLTGVAKCSAHVK